VSDGPGGQKIAGTQWAQQDGHDLIFSSEHGGMITPRASPAPSITS
jgi:hypothetical protein